MSSNVVLGYINNIMLGTLTASSSANGLGPEQLQNDQGNVAAAWQSTTASAQTLTLSAPSGSKWQGFGLFRTNLRSVATVTVVVRNGGSGGTIVLSASLSAVVPGFGQMVYVATQEVVGDWCQFTITDTANPDGHYNIALAYAGPVFQPSRNATYQSAPGRTSQTVTAATRAGGVIVRNDWNKRVFNLAFSGLLAGEIPTLMELDLAGRQGNNVFFVPDRLSSTIGIEAIFGEFAPTSGFTYPYPTPNARGYTAVVTERL